jgi:hypothetical protein
MFPFFRCSPNFLVAHINIVQMILQRGWMAGRWLYVHVDIFIIAFWTDKLTERCTDSRINPGWLGNLMFPPA